jgi:hypothetical protein
MHYKPPASKKRKNPPKKKGPEISKDECVVMLSGATNPDLFVDKRTDKSKCGRVAVPESPSDLKLYIMDVRAKKSNPGSPAPQRSTPRSRKRRGASAQTSARRSLNQQTNQVQALAVPAEVRAAQTEALKAQDIGNVPGVVMPENPAKAFSLGVVQGYEIAKRDCPTSDILGVGIVFPKWKKISKVIEQQKKDEAARVLRSAQEPFGMTEPDQLLSDFENGGETLALTEGVSSTDAYIQGVYMGKLYGYKACPFKWMPFNANMADIREEIRNIELWKEESLRDYLRQRQDAIDSMLRQRERGLAAR